MAKKICMALTLLFFCGALTQAQTIDELKASLDQTKKEIARLTTEQSKLETELENQGANGWVFGGTGGIVFNTANFNNWVFSDGTNASNIAGSLNLYANNNQDKFFWNNAAQFKLGYINNKPQDKFSGGIMINDTVTIEPPMVDSLLSLDDWDRNLDEIYITSLFGYKVSETIAASVLADFRTSFGEFADPAYLSIGAGVTFSPNTKFKLVVHPATWRAVMVKSDSKKAGFEWEDYDSNLKGEFGAKIMADYKDEIAKNLFWNSNLSAFFSYTDFNSPEVQWTNTFSYTLNRYITATFEHAIRYYKPETNGAYLAYIEDLQVEAGILEEDNTYFSTLSPETISNILTNAEANDRFSYLQNRWLFTIGITTSF